MQESRDTPGSSHSGSGSDSGGASSSRSQEQVGPQSLFIGNAEREAPELELAGSSRVRFLLQRRMIDVR